MKNIFLLTFFIFSCNSFNQTQITEQEVKDKFYEFFEVLSVNNPDKNKLYELVTDDYFIFENQKKYSMKEFIQFVNTFRTIEDEWELSEFEIENTSNAEENNNKEKNTPKIPIVVKDDDDKDDTNSGNIPISPKTHFDSFLERNTSDNV